MKKMRRIIALALFVCLVISLLPQQQIVRAADVMQRYELDTDGIDPGATYLIVNTGTPGSANALNFYYGSNNTNRKFLNQAIKVETDENGVRYVASGFTDEADCQFQFSGRESGKITHGDYGIDLRNGRYTTSSNATNITFEEVGGGAYQIQYTYGYYYYSTTYYLRFNNSSWESYSRGTAHVYLYKLVEYEVGNDIIFDGNGYTSGKLPANQEKLSTGAPYTIPFPEEELRKDVGLDTWLFLCWNTEPDGSGVEYTPGTEITVTEDLTLYADWYQQTKFTVSMITELDGVRTDVDQISGQNKSFAIKKGDGEYIPLEKTEDGTYITKVVENGDYVVYSKVDGGEYEPVHGHLVTIYNQDGATVCQHFTVNYDTHGGVWEEGQDPGHHMAHALENVTLTPNVPTLEGNRFLHWVDQHGNTYAAGAQIETILEKITLTAVWEKTINVTIHVTIDHNSEDGGYNNAENCNDLTLQIFRRENGVDLPLEQKELSSEDVPETNIITYTVELKDQPQGIYHVAATKSDYETKITYSGAANEDQQIFVTMKYAPSNFDLVFDVKVNADQGEEELMPKAVNVKVTYWGYKDGVPGWYTITQQEGNNAPTTIAIDENGEGRGYLPVWSYWPNIDYAYVYRLVVTSFVMPDNKIVSASDFNSVESGLYHATLFVENGKKPTHPTTDSLEGAYFDGNAQAGSLTVEVEITPFTVTFDAEEGQINGQNQLVLKDQYRYPDPSDYTPVPNNEESVFLGWYDQNGNPASSLTGKYLTENVVLTARYGDDITLTGVVQVATTYEQDGQQVNIHDIDLLSEVMVLVRKQVGNQFITLNSQLVPVVYEDGEIYGEAEFTFDKLPNDGTNYQISVLAANYDSLYDCNLDDNYTADDFVVTVDAENASAEAKARLNFNPEQYHVGLKVDASQIAEGFRPTGALAQIMYRDLGDVFAFNVISQHTVPPYGIQITQDNMGLGYGSDDVWIRHVDGTYYEYQIGLSKLYGSVEGAYIKEGTDFTEDSPFTVSYGAPSNYMKQEASGESVLEATLIPKEYPVYLDLNIPKEATAPVRGVDEFLVDTGDGELQHAYIHTWSYAASFDAYPYLEGFVFTGWEETAETADDKELVVKDGNVYVGATLAKPVTLTAKWKPLSGTDFTVRHLELNTNKVLHGAQVFSGFASGQKIMAVDYYLSIPGYEYAGAMVDGTYVHKATNPAMIVSTDPVENLLIIYYLPDSSSGYTEQVESNLVANKTAILEDNGTYTITLDTYTKESPVTTKIRFDTPLDVVLVLDQSGSMYQNGALPYLKEAVSNFISQLADHGRNNEVDHRVAIVGYASDEDDGYSRTSYPTAGKDGSYFWYNTGVFGVHGDFHPYSYTGFNYTEYTGNMDENGTYYTIAHGEYLLLTYHEEYRHLITEEEARQALLDNYAVYGYVDGQFVELTRNSSGLWLYGDKLLYTSTKFFTYHTDVWTHREGLERREIHAYGLGAIGTGYKEVGEHSGVYTRTATKDANPQKSLYEEALIPISLGANGSGGVTPGLTAATQKLGANGTTHVSYGMEMANKIFAANPLEVGSDRERIIIVFTDGKPGDGSNFDEEEANSALAYAAYAQDEYKANIYAIGLYGSDVVAAESDQVFFMNGLSSNYPDATTMDDIWVTTTYKPAINGIRVDLGGPYYVLADGQYRKLTLSSLYENKTFYNCWGYEDANGNRVVISTTPNADGHPMINNSMLGNYTLYHQYGEGYKDAEGTGFYVEANSSTDLKEYFAKIMRDITTNVTTEIILDEDTILRDILNEGLVFTDNTVITVSTQKGVFNEKTEGIDWVVDASGNPVTTKIVELELSTGDNTASGKDPAVGENSEVKINIFNQNVENDPDRPHTVDVTGYNYAEWYISKDHDTGYKMIVEITNIEARDNVQWGRSYATNHERSGLWLPADENENRQLLFAFDQPTTIFVQRAYVLDYGKEFELTNWYFDDEDGNDATPAHLDLDIANGMNGFDTPNLKNETDGAYGNTAYGNVRLDDKTGKVYYSPTTMSWGGYDSFYVFGETWRKTVKAQDANENGNLWNKVTVIPANNIYYEDSFITKAAENQGNAIEGFVFSGEWQTVYDNGVENAGQNVEHPEHLESAPYGDVHGWTDSLGDDKKYTDGSAHAAGLLGMENRLGATAQFTFTGTGVDVYSRTNSNSGVVIAMLYQQVTNDDGETELEMIQGIVQDNLAVSGDYYHIPTISFDVPYGTYTVELIATMSSEEATGDFRYEYYLDGVRVYNPLGTTTSYHSETVKNAYGLENNAVFKEVRDILLDYGDFNTGLTDGDDGKMGAVFIDWIREGQGTNNDKPGESEVTYEIGTFKSYGPKNEVYLTAGQAIVMKVDEDNTYYVGMKSLTGNAVEVNVSGIDLGRTPATIEISHSTDMYYRVNPVDGYIVIQNGNTSDEEVLAITNLRTTNEKEPADNAGVLPVKSRMAVMTMRRFAAQLQENETFVEDPVEEEVMPPEQPQVDTMPNIADALFVSVRQWLKKD